MVPNQIWLLVEEDAAGIIGSLGTFHPSFYDGIRRLKVPVAVELQDAVEINGSQRNQFQKRTGNIQRVTDRHSRRRRESIGFH
jgi:hypothetical protein